MEPRWRLDREFSRACNAGRRTAMVDGATTAMDCRQRSWVRRDSQYTRPARNGIAPAVFLSPRRGEKHSLHQRRGGFRIVADDSVDALTDKSHRQILRTEID